MKKTLFILLSTALFIQAGYSQSYKLSSPDGQIQVTVKTESGIFYSVEYQEKTILARAPLRMSLQACGTLGDDPSVRNTSVREVDETIQPVVPEKKSIIRDHYNELVISFDKPYDVIFRAYNEGIAYRFKTYFEEQVTVQSEQVDFPFTGDHELFFAGVEGFITHQESTYDQIRLSQVPRDTLGIFPTVIRIADGPVVALTEADLYDYPGMYFQGSGRHALQGTFPRYVTKEKQVGDRTVVAEERADFLAKTDGKRTYPWRVLAIAEQDADLITNQLVYQLSTPCQIEKTEWIKPGMVAWDWWNANNIHGVDFKAGINTETYKHYIDFAAEYGLDYIILDEGWSDTEDLFDIHPDIDLEEITQYAASQDVGIILWMVWKVLDDQLERAMDRFQELGIKGIKVDFMQRDDQWMVNYYERIARSAAEHQLMVDFHGSYKPSGLRRAYPNVMTREGVAGLEQAKWSEHPTPEYNVTLPFIRQMAGPIDYTPGAMHNTQKDNFAARYTRPMSLGTRCHQMAMYVVFESPLQMMADSPNNYRKEKESASFIADMPVVWDETRVLQASIGNYLALARKKENTWYLAAMTDWDARDMQLNLDFLGEGNYTIEIFRDGINAERHAEDYQKRTRQVTASDKLNIHMASGGGWVAKITPR